MLYQRIEAQHSNRFAKVGAPFLIESHTRGYQRHPQLAALNGGFVTAWTDDASPPCEIGGSDVRAKLLSATGHPFRGELLVNSETIDHQRHPRIAGFPNGGFVVIWQDFSGRGGDACGGSIKAKLFDFNGRFVRDELLVNVETHDTQFNANVAALADGAFVVVWQSYKGAGRAGVRGRLFKPDGAPAGEEFLLSSCPEGRQNSPAVAGLSNGGFVAVWNDPDGMLPDANGSIKVKVFGSTGAIVREELLVTARTLKNPTPPAVSGLGDGGFVIIWTDHIGGLGDGCRVGIKARAFHSSGEPRSNEFLISPPTLNRRTGAALSSLSGSGFVVAWTDCHGRGDANRSTVIAEVFQSNGTAIGEKIPVSADLRGDNGHPAVAGLAGGGFVVAWEDPVATDDDGVSVKAQIFESIG